MVVWFYQLTFNNSKLYVLRLVGQWDKKKKERKTRAFTVTTGYVRLQRRRNNITIIIIIIKCAALYVSTVSQCTLLFHEVMADLVACVVRIERRWKNPTLEGEPQQRVGAR